jgi:predicted ATPase
VLVEQIHVEGYRSLRNITVKLDQINVIVGANGSGKSNLYRSLYLVHAAATGQFARELANEGGMPSVLWAGKRRKTEDARVHLQVTFDEMEYELAFGRVPLSEMTSGMEAFVNDPDIKEEQVSINYRGKSNVIVKRARGMLTAKNMDGRNVEYPLSVAGSESILSGLREPHKFPELSSLRDEFFNWRFYHDFRTDLDSPLRQPQIGTLTPVLAHDGKDVAAALATIQAIGDPEELAKLVDDAFPGTALKILFADGQFSMSMVIPELFREFEAFEFSDGTLQYICLLATLLSPRPPSLLTLNEPETSIHPDLYEPMAKLIARAAKNSQVIVTTHAEDLASYIRKFGGAKPMVLEKVDGETRLVGAKLTEDGDDEVLHSRPDEQDEE